MKESGKREKINARGVEWPPSGSTGLWLVCGLPRIPNDRTRNLLRGGYTLHHRSVSHSNHGQSDYVAFIVAHAQTHAGINPLIRWYRSRECVWEESVAQWREFVAMRQGWNGDDWECMADQWERIKNAITILSFLYGRYDSWTLE